MAQRIWLSENDIPEITIPDGIVYMEGPAGLYACKPADALTFARRVFYAIGTWESQQRGVSVLPCGCDHPAHAATP